MKPSFALDFRDGLIALLHRTTRGWSQVGASPVDAADLAEALTYLRSTALGLSPRGLTTKLVIPNEMILYTQVHAPGPDVAKRRRQIKLALEGLTPYKVDDLVFDWWGTGPDVQVAVVARETLAEAEGFAVEHRFNPVSFVGAPENGSYLGEPFFGPSALSATLLGEGEKVERDQEPVSVLARDFGKGPAIETPAIETPAVITPAVEAPAVAAAPPVSRAAEPAEVAARAETPAPKPAPMVEPVASPEPAAPAPAKVAEKLPDFSGATAPPAASSFDPAALAVDLVDEAPMAVDVAEEPAPPVASPTSRLSEPPVTARQAEPAPPKPPAAKAADAKPAEVKAVSDDLPPSPASAVIAAFASRRAAEPDAAEPADKPRKTSPNLGPAPLQRPAVPRPTLAKPPAPLPSASRDSTLPFPTKGTGQGGKFSPGKSTRPMVSAPNALAAKRDRNVVQLPQPAAADGSSPVPEAKPASKAATGLDGRPVPPRGKPRYLGLILTAILLVALALVAAWSSYYLTSNEPDPNVTPAPNAVAATDPAPAADTAASDATASDAMPSAADEALADGQDPAAVETATTADATAVAPLPETPLPETPPPETTPTEPVAAKPEPAPGTQVTTEAAQAATPGNDPQDEIFLADADTPPQTSDPLVMPDLLASSDPPPDTAAPPPPYGTLYTFDAEGRIQPTPKGIVTPEGVLLIAGKPPVVPPTRPAQTAAEPPVAPAPDATAAALAPAAATPDATAAAPDATAAALAPTLPFPSDPALADKRPKSRPAGLPDPAAATAKQGEALAPDVNSRLAQVRPQPRPAALTTQTAAAPPDAELDNTAAAASLALNGVKPSTLAVITSKKPAARPSGMDQAVNAAVAAAARQPDPQPQAQPQAQPQVASAPEAEPEPEVENAAPSLPTNASVAKQATDKRAIALNRVALLGIFGTASGRYAMIRQPTGGVKKIKVGDRIDGGQVAAITANAVQYQKGGQMLTLSLPTG